MPTLFLFLKYYFLHSTSIFCIQLPFFDSISGKFADLIPSLAKKFGSRVVVLIDEYDKAIVNHLGKGEKELEVASQNREIVKGLFGVLKEHEVSDVLRFAFLTGVSKFSRVSVFSDLNNLEDLTMAPSFLNFLYRYWIEVPDTSISNQFLFLHRYLKNVELEPFVETMNNILAAVPYQHIAKKDEAWFHTMFYLMLSASGVEVLTEVITSKGRIDIAIFFEDKTYIIELKCNQTAQKAIQQIRDKGYADRYRDHSPKILLVGINFDSIKWQITDWKKEEL